MRKVPERQNPVAVGGRGDARHVQDGATRVIDVGEHQDGHAAIEVALDVRPIDLADGVPAPQQLDQAFRNVEVGGKVAGFGQDEVPARLQTERAGQQLEEIDRGAVRHDHLAGVGSYEPGNLVPHPAGRVHPAGIIPAADEPASPLLPDHLLDPGRSLSRQRPQRVAVQVDDSVGDREVIAYARQGILLVEAEAGLTVHGGIIRARCSRA